MTILLALAQFVHHRVPRAASARTANATGGREWKVKYGSIPRKNVPCTWAEIPKPMVSASRLERVYRARGGAYTIDAESISTELRGFVCIRVRWDSSPCAVAYSWDCRYVNKLPLAPPLVQPPPPPTTTTSSNSRGERQLQQGDDGSSKGSAKLFAGSVIALVLFGLVLCVVGAASLYYAASTFKRMGRPKKV